MTSLKSLFETVIYKSAQVRGEDHANSVILNKNIIKSVIQRLSEDQLKQVIIDFTPPPASTEGEEFGQWLEACRRILEMNQTDFGDLIEATQAEVSRFEKAKPLGELSRDRLNGIVHATIRKIGSLKKPAA